MARLYRESDRGREGYRLRFRDQHQKQRSLWLGGMSARSAETVQRHVTELVRASKANVQPETGSVKWVQSLDGRLRDRLASYGLVNGSSVQQQKPRTLSPFIDRYIEERTDAKPSTITNFRHAKRWLLKFFDAEVLLADITKADADRFQRYLQNDSGLADSTIEKILKRTKTLFRHAVRDRILEESPFDDLKIRAAINRERDAFVDAAITERVLRCCPNANWQVIFGLARFAGLRTPSETLKLRWADVDFESGRLRVDSPKTGLRECPLFPELRPLLEAARDDARASTEFVVSRYRGSGKNLRTGLIRILKSGGITPWPKLFVNLRATCRTELQERFPDHVVNTWLGHSSRVAEKHYLQVTADHWASASGQIGGNAGGNICANLEASEKSAGQKKQGIHGSEAHRFPVIADLAPRAEPSS